MKRVLAAFSLVVLVAFNSYAAKGKASSAVVEEAQTSSAMGEYTVNIVFDNGVTDDIGASLAKAQNQIGDWMKEDLVRVFARYAKDGFEGKLVNKVNKDDKYLLSVKIIKYNAGSKAARMMVGYGAGSVSLDVHYQLVANGKVLASKDDGVASGRDWRNAARKVNENVAKDVVKLLKK